jgi:hypothetical protein
MIDRLENAAIDLVAKLAPWCAPMPTAYLVGRATMIHLAWPSWVAFIAALVIESLGLATTATALALWNYNKDRRKTDPRAPVALALAMIGVYYVVATGLTVLLDIVSGLAVYAPAIFPTLSLTGVTVLALRSDHRRRLATIESVKQERKAERQMKRQGAVARLSNQASNNERFDTNLDALRAARASKRDARLDALLTFLASNPDAGPTEAGRAIGVTRQTVYNYERELEAAGRLRRDGDGWETR